MIIIRNHIRKTLALVLCLTVILSAFGGAFTAANGYDINPYSGLTGKTSWNIDSNGKLTVTGTGSLEFLVSNSGTGYACSPLWKDRLDEIASVVIGPGITEISDSSFYNCTNLKSISIPDTVTSISYDAFRNCSSLTELYIPSGVNDIEISAFDGCSALERITVDPANASFSSDDRGVLFDKDKTVLIKYPAGSTEPEYTLPYSVTEIENLAFCGAKTLEKAELPDGLKKIGVSAFSDCYALRSIDLPDSVSSIGGNAFSGCSSLTECILPDGLTSLGQYVFMNCSALNYVYIPAGVTSLSCESFTNCRSLKNVSIDKNNKKYCNEDEVVFNKDMTELILYPMGRTGAGYEIPDTVKTIGNHAFAGCTGLKFVHIPSTVTKIESYSYYDSFINTDLEYICSDSVGSRAKSYADEKGVDFVLCSGGDHSEAFSLTELEINAGAQSVSLRGEYPDSVRLALTADGVSADGEDYFWKSSDEEIVKVGGDGTVTAVHCGEAAVTVSGEKCADDEIKVIVGHDYKPTVTKPTCTENGYTEYTCADCGDSYQAEQTAAPGHFYVDGICTGCGEKSPDLLLSEAKEAALRELDEIKTGCVSDEAKAVIEEAAEKINSLTDPEGAESVLSEAEEGATAADEALENAKVKAVNALNEVKNGAVSDSAKEIAAAAIDEIENATSLEEVDSLKSKAYADASADEKVLEYAKSNAASELEEEETSAVSDEAKTILRDAAEAVQNAATTAEAEALEKKALADADAADKALADAKAQAASELEEIKTSAKSSEAREIAETALDDLNGATNLDSVASIKEKAVGEAAAADDCNISGHRFENGFCRVCGHVQYWDYTITNGKAVIDGYSGNDFELKIPSTLEGAPVVGISDSAFAKNGNLFYVRIPESVTSIGENAFRGCSILSEVYMCGSASIASGAFADCPFLALFCANAPSVTAAAGAFDGCDERLNIIAPKGSKTLEVFSKQGFSCTGFEYPVLRGESKVIAFSGKTVLYRDFDYNYWAELVLQCPDAVYLRFDSLELEGIAPDAAEGSLDESHYDPKAENLTFLNIYISVRIDGEVITFDKLTEMLNNGYSELILAFDDDDGGSMTLLQRIGDGLKKVFHALTKIINAVIRVFKK